MFIAQAATHLRRGSDERTIKLRYSGQLPCPLVRTAKFVGLARL